MELSEQAIPIRDLLNQECGLPENPKNDCIVLWKVFRKLHEALEYARHILLEPDQKLVGGHAHDSAGEFWWLGVKVADLAAWGNSQAIQLADPFDANDPKGQGRGVSA